MTETKRERALRLAREELLPPPEGGIWWQADIVALERLISLANAEMLEEAVKMMRMGIDAGIPLTALYALEQATREERDAD